MNTHKKLLLTAVSALGLCLSPLHAEFIPLLLDFGPTTPTGANLTNSPYHAVSGASFETWNILGTSDVASGLLWGNGTAATGVTLDLGVSGDNNTVNESIIDFSTQPSSSSALGGRTNTGVFDGNSVGKDAIFNSGSPQLGLKIGGLALDTYYVYVVGINTNLGNFASNPNDGNLIPMNIGALATGDVATLDTDGLSAVNIPNNVFSSWSQGANYARFEVTLTNDNPYLTIFTYDNSNRGFLNAVQIVAIPEPGTLVLLGIALGTLLIFRRRQ
ncbi:MAG: PEP-CTERM sorting domain-containing protein [Verrucomicrobia bacterium]|nr:PEP-CTERM sorting domain-containing protein [Verrucomicrobiota bacterium]MCH8511904.1 PEP-CTERM sorting domain-containing protein [Kiritimatiellia bacterium]